LALETRMNNLSKRFINIAAVFGATAVGFGAFGAHALEDMLRESGRTGTFETAVLYHFVHTFAVLFVAILYDKIPHKKTEIAGYLFTSGIIIFSGSLYILCLSGANWLGAITPIGGILFIMGWIFLVVAKK